MEHALVAPSAHNWHTFAKLKTYTERLGVDPCQSVLSRLHRFESCREVLHERTNGYTQEDA